MARQEFGIAKSFCVMIKANQQLSRAITQYVRWHVGNRHAKPSTWWLQQWEGLVEQTNGNQAAMLRVVSEALKNEYGVLYTQNPDRTPRRTVQPITGPSQEDYEEEFLTEEEVRRRKKQ